MTPEQQRREEIARKATTKVGYISRADVRWLLDQLEQAQARERGLREALERIEREGTRDATPLGRIGYPPPAPAVELSYEASIAHAALAAQSEGSES